MNAGAHFFDLACGLAQVKRQIKDGKYKSFVYTENGRALSQSVQQLNLLYQAAEKYEYDKWPTKNDSAIIALEIKMKPFGRSSSSK